MSSVAEQVEAEFLDSVRATQKHQEDVEKMLAQTLQVLAKLGNQTPFNIDGVLQQGKTERERLNKNVQRVVGHMLEMERLVKTSALITTSLEISHVLAEVADTVIYLTGAERAFLLLLEDQNWRVMTARNDQGDDLDLEAATFSRGVVQSAIEQRKPIITTNAQADERFQDMKSVMRNDLRSIMVVPMFLQNKPLGALYLDNRLALAVFQQKSLPIITAFANQAAIAIENARLFERVQENLKQAQQEVHRLRIQLDSSKMQAQVEEITASDYFQDLANIAKKRRDKE